MPKPINNRIYLRVKNKIKMWINCTKIKYRRFLLPREKWKVFFFFFLFLTKIAFYLFILMQCNSTFQMHQNLKMLIIFRNFLIAIAQCQLTASVLLPSAISEQISGSFTHMQCTLKLFVALYDCSEWVRELLKLPSSHNKWN